MRAARFPTAASRRSHCASGSSPGSAGGLPSRWLASRTSGQHGPRIRRPGFTRSAQRNRAIEPFRQRLSQITTYPLQREALFTIAALAVMRLVGYVPVLGWLLDLMVIVAILRSAGEVLYRTAHGRMDPPADYSTDDHRG